MRKIKNKLFITNNSDDIKTLAHEFAIKNKLEFLSFTYCRDSITTINTMYRNYNNMVIFLENINHDNISNGLLKVLEDNTKNIYMYATTIYSDLSKALLARFEVQEHMTRIDDVINDFIHNKQITKDDYSRRDFYIFLAEYITKHPDKHFTYNLRLINNIIENMSLCTYNIPYQMYYDILKESYRRC